MDIENSHIVVIAYIASNIIGLLFLWAAIKRPKLARLLLVLLFGWASWVNYTGAHETPQAYLTYSQYALGLYRSFINGWFSTHVTVFVSFIALGQALIAVGMLLNGMWVKLACIGVIIFLLGIAPIGYYAGFPFSLTVSAAAYSILRKDDLNYLWNFHMHKIPAHENQ